MTYDNCQASVKRVDAATINEQVKFMVANPVVDVLLQTTVGVLAILNDRRQIVAVNETLLNMLNVNDAEKLLGLRFGEVVQCRYAQNGPDGCGTGEQCNSCGAAIAIMTAIVKDKAIERECAISTELCDFYFSLKVSPIVFDGDRYFVLLAQDVSHKRSWEIMERNFFHDVNNVMTGLSGCLEVFNLSKRPAMIDRMSVILKRLQSEVDIQRTLTSQTVRSYRPVFADVALESLMNELSHDFETMEIAQHKRMELPRLYSIWLWTDSNVLLKILTNLLVNALEATDLGGTVRLTTNFQTENVTFEIWNAGVVHVDAQRRMFQRNFSTKPERGRGIGTFVAKTLTENVLKGTISFSSSDEAGTIFSLVLPNSKIEK